MKWRTIVLMGLGSWCALGDEGNEADDEGWKPSPKMEQAGEILWKAQNKFVEEKRNAEAAYRSRLAEAFRLVDWAEVMLLDFEVEPKPKGREVGEFFGEVEGFERRTHLFVPNYDAYSRIIKTKKMEGDSLKQLVSAVDEVFKEPIQGRGPLCHFPIHGIRLYIGDELFFETSFCWHCSNYFMRMTGEWDGMWVDFRGEKLEEFLKKEMPIPKAELDRFNAKYGRKEKKEEK